MSKYLELRKERKELQKEKALPDWYTTNGWQLFKDRYYWAESPRAQYSQIAMTAADHVPHLTGAEANFFQLLWKGWLSPSTPVLSNMGNPKRGMPVSCSGGHIDDSIAGFYKARLETAVLTKHGFGTSGYLGDVRHRGAPCKTGTASGVVPLIEGFIRDMRDVAQGASRRGAWAGYLPMMHGDFDEVCDGLLSHPDDKNIGWCITNEDIENLQKGDPETLRRYQKILHVRMVRGKGYLFFTDKSNALMPYSMKRIGLDIKASNLCTEIMLPSDECHTFTCVLSSMNLAKWDEWKDTDAVYWATIFLDCVAEEFLTQASSVPELDKAVRFTERSRALGLGATGWHTLLQKERLPFESLEAQFLNTTIFKHMKQEALRASYDLGKHFGECDWMEGTGRRNSHLCVAGDTKILTTDGSVEIQSVVGKKVDVWNGKEWSTVTPYKTGSNDELYKVVFSDGRTLTTTADHIFLIVSPKRSNTEYIGQNILLDVKAVDLRAGDCIPKYYGAVVDNVDMPVLPHAYTNGAFSGDGNVNYSKDGKYPRNELRLYDGKVNLKPRFFVPINYSLQSRLDWLAGLIDTDGSSSSKGVSISTVNEAFADKIMDMLTTLGCFGHKSITKEAGKTDFLGVKCERQKLFTINLSMVEVSTLVSLGLVTNRVVLNPTKNNTLTKIHSKQFVEVVSVTKVTKGESFCFTEPINNTGVFNGVLTRQCAVAPTKSTSLIMGGISEGISPDPAMVYTQRTASGDVRRIAPEFLRFLNENNLNTEEHLQEVLENFGSVQNVDWMSSDMKKVFKTAFEIDQHVIVRYASQRQEHVCQGQSLNLFFDGRADPDYISSVHEQAVLDPNILSLYYVYSRAGVSTDHKLDECEACQ